MSAPPFFLSAGRGHLKFWREDDGPTVVVWESLSESEQEQWSKKMGKAKDWVVWCRSKKKDEEQRPFEADGKEIFSNHCKQANAKAKAGEKEDKKAGKGQSVRWKACRVATEQHQMRSERRVCFVLGSPRLLCGRRGKSSFEESGLSIRRKRRMSGAIERERTRLPDGHRDRHARRLWVPRPSNSQ